MFDETRLDLPSLVVEPAQLAGLDPSLSTMLPIPGSQMFEVRHMLDRYREKYPDGELYNASQGDGGASLSGVPPEVLEAAGKLQAEQGSAYDQTYGTDLFRRTVVEDYWSLQTRTGWGEGNVIACHGGRDALMMAYDAVQHLGHGRRGDFMITSRVPWVSYNWGPYALGSNVLLAPGDPAEGWKITPEAVRECARWAEQEHGRRIAALILTTPDNPTGRTLTIPEQVDLVQTALTSGIPYVLMDWIYHYVTDEDPYDVNEFLCSLDPEDRDRCIIMDGITKALGGSNIRNAHLLASEKVIQHIRRRNSHCGTPSFYSQAVAVAAYRMGYRKASEGIVGPTNASRAVLREFFSNRPMDVIMGQGYYAFINAGPWIEKAGMRHSGDLGRYLAQEFGVSVVAGKYFSRFAGNWIRFSYALPPEKTLKAARRLMEALESIKPG